MYGTGAMFGVINLITKHPDERASLTAGVGSQSQQNGSLRAGVRRGELTAAVALSWQEQDGGSLYIREFDSPATNHGVTRGNNYDDYNSVMGTVAWRELKILALQTTRTKGVPTASWGTRFGGDEQTTDGRSMIAATFDRRIGTGRSFSLRAFVDHFQYAGIYPNPDADYRVRADSIRKGAELRYLWDIRPNQRLTVGAAYVASNAADDWTVSGYSGGISEKFATLSASAQLESEITSRLSITAGGSYDRRAGVDPSISPRGAVLFHASPHSTLKLLYGAGFRTPSMYELRYESPDSGWIANDELVPERIQTHELVWEQELTPDLLLTTSLFHLEVSNLVRLYFDPELTQFRNSADVHSQGVEVQFDYRRSNGVWSYLSLARQNTDENGKAMTNSPSTIVCGGVSTPTSRALYGGIEAQYQSGRPTFAGNRTEAALLTNLNVGYSLNRFLTLSVAVRNLFDADYAVPAGPEHLQDAIVQDGRTYLVKLQVRGR
jgi:iron complex outermembrane receptor protein